MVRPFLNGTADRRSGTESASSRVGSRDDARNKIISNKRSKVSDARDKLASLAKTTDARAKLQKIRDLKSGKLEVKTTARGGITITQTTQGKTLLTTKKKNASNRSMVERKTHPLSVSLSDEYKGSRKVDRSPTATAPRSSGRLHSGKRELVAKRGGNSALRSSRSLTDMRLKPFDRKSLSGGIASRSRPLDRGRRSPPSSGRWRHSPSPDVSRNGRNGSGSHRSHVRHFRNAMSDAARMEPIGGSGTTYMDAVVLKRTIQQDVRNRSPEVSPSLFYRGNSGGVSRVRSPVYYVGGQRIRSRTRSPIDLDRYEAPYGAGGGPQTVLRRSITSPQPLPPRRHMYDNLRRGDVVEDEEQRYRPNTASTTLSSTRRQRSLEEPMIRTMGDHLDQGMLGTSPLQGVKVVVSNLQSSVSQDDIIELFGDIGALKRARVLEPGSAEVVFVNRSDALKAVEIYHNRQLDGKAMKCHVVGGHRPERITNYRRV